MVDQLQLELYQIEEDLAAGLITRHEADQRYANTMSQAEHDAKCAAEDAYDREMQDRGFGRR